MPCSHHPEYWLRWLTTVCVRPLSTVGLAVRVNPLLAKRRKELRDRVECSLPGGIGVLGIDGMAEECPYGRGFDAVSDDPIKFSRSDSVGDLSSQNLCMESVEFGLEVVESSRYLIRESHDLILQLTQVDDGGRLIL